MRENPIVQRIVTFFRRVGAIILAVLTLALLTLLMLFPRTMGEALDGMNGFLRLLIVVAADGALLYLIYRQVRALSGVDQSALLLRSGGAITELTSQSLQDRLQKAVQAVNGVVANTVHVEAVRGRAKLTLTVSVKSQVTNLPALQKEIVKAIDTTVRQELGVALAGQPMLQMSMVDAAQPTVPAAPSNTTPPSTVVDAGHAVPTPDDKVDEHKGLGIFRRERPPHTDEKAPAEDLPDAPLVEIAASKDPTPIAHPAVPTSDVDAPASDATPSTDDKPKASNPATE